MYCYRVRICLGATPEPHLVVLRRKQEVSQFNQGCLVTVVGNTQFKGSSDLSAHRGKRGVVEHPDTRDDGHGLCRVRLECGTLVWAWRGVDIHPVVATT